LPQSKLEVVVMAEVGVALELVVSEVLVVVVEKAEE
jgi:hypothetical protein